MKILTKKHSMNFFLTFFDTVIIKNFLQKKNVFGHFKI
jgi:hypothetical protein